VTSPPEVQYRTPGERGHGIRALRTAAGLTATAVATAIGVRPSTVYNWEHGRCRIPEDQLPALAEALGSNLEDVRVFLRSAVPVPPPRRSSHGLALLRRRSGLSRRAAALRLDVSIEVLGRWEREGPPTWHALRRLAATYGVSVEVAARATGSTAPRVLDPRRWVPGDLPQVVRVLRSWAGLTQRELADRLGCSPETVRGWESARGLPSPEHRRRLEAAYGLRPDVLLAAYPRRRAELDCQSGCRSEDSTTLPEKCTSCGVLALRPRMPSCAGVCADDR